MTRSRANAPVVKKSDLTRPPIPTRPLTDAEIRARADEQAKEVRALATGVKDDGTKQRKPHAQWNDDEHIGQSLFFKIEVPKLVAKYPDVKRVMGLPLFQTGKKGKAGAVSGQRANDEGRRKGTFDICYPVARAMWHSLWIESKIDASVTKEQREFQYDMISVENLALVVRADDAKSLALELSRVVELYECSGPYGALGRFADQDDSVFELQRLLSCQIR